MRRAKGPRMAAVFCLVMLPAIAAIGFMLKVTENTSFGALAAITCFAMLASGVFLGLLKMARGWEAEADH